MKPPVETLRISQLGREQLIKLRRQTGIEHWNVLCRWAFCVSMREKTVPILTSEKLEGGVEMTWKVFSGDQSEIYSALCLNRAIKDGFPLGQEGAAACLRAHVHRGLTFLASGKDTKSISDLATRWLGLGFSN
jgi:DNA sulfur modification protein DndE